MDAPEINEQPVSDASKEAFRIVEYITETTTAATTGFGDYNLEALADEIMEQTEDPEVINKIVRVFATLTGDYRDAAELRTILREEYDVEGL
jgi:hypothetical protein